MAWGVLDRVERWRYILHIYLDAESTSTKKKGSWLFYFVNECKSFFFTR